MPQPRPVALRRRGRRWRGRLLNLLLLVVGAGSLAFLGWVVLRGPLVPAGEPPVDFPSEIDVEEAPVGLEILSDTTGVAPGMRFRVGVLFEIAPGWHLFWKNPGDAGLPTSVEVVPPDGLHVSDVQWPAPIRFSQPDGLAGYGYRDEVFLAVDVEAPPDLPVAPELSFDVHVSWLACERVCIPGESLLQLHLPITNAPEPARAGLFDEWEAQVARPYSADDAPFGLAIETTAEPGGTRTYALVLEWEDPPAQIEWFPEADAALQMSEARLETIESRSIISFGLETVSGEALPPPVLGGVVAYVTPDGRRRAVTVQIPVALGHDIEPSD